jgi:hypothetical protein
MEANGRGSSAVPAGLGMFVRCPGVETLVITHILGKDLRESQRDSATKPRGCEERATLGPSRRDQPTPTGLCPWAESVLNSAAPPKSCFVRVFRA